MAACTKFVHVEKLGGAEAAPKRPAAPESTATKAEPALKGDTNLDKLLSEAVEAADDDDGWAHLGAIGSNLPRRASNFDTRTWGSPSSLTSSKRTLATMCSHAHQESASPRPR